MRSHSTHVSLCLLYRKLGYDSPAAGGGVLSHPVQVQHHSAEGGPPLDVMSSPLSSLRRSVMSSPKSSQDSESEGLSYTANRPIHQLLWAMRYICIIFLAIPIEANIFAQLVLL